MSVAYPSAPNISTLADSIDRALEGARRGQGLALVTYLEELPVVPDPLAFLAAGARSLGNGTFWSQPRGRQIFASAGAAYEVTAAGSGRFGQITAAFNSVRDGLSGHDAAAVFPLLCEFAFDKQGAASSIWRDFPNSRLIVPAAMLQIEGGRASLRVTQRVGKHESTSGAYDRFSNFVDRCRTWTCETQSPTAKPTVVGSLAMPDRRTWESSVATAVAQIQQGALDKVVLAREERLLADRAWSAIATLADLNLSHPDVTLFAVQSGHSWFIGATPERLVRVHDGHVAVSCLAGSVAIGDSAEQQQRNAERLLASAKDREEQEIVVRSTVDALKELCQDVERLPGTPRVIASRTVQHLETPVTARLYSAGNVLDVVERLHPTPAVGGFPCERALTTIRELEEIDRGWYAGPIGWIDVNGSGEFAVAIRSALLTGRSASLFAGSGIVRGSNPTDEFLETRLKLGSMYSALVYK